jgi:hypothetical protein
MVLLSSNTVKPVKNHSDLKSLNNGKLDIIVEPVNKKDLLASVCNNVNFTEADIKNTLKKKELKQ